MERWPDLYANYLTWSAAQVHPVLHCRVRNKQINCRKTNILNFFHKNYWAQGGRSGQIAPLSKKILLKQILSCSIQYITCVSTNI